ncbi:MAG: DUF3465 domain-containing protein [Phycisphaerae bacterium]|nr:DUF3465 domain-containing protein [Phycisphaerales bacterium]
MPRRRKRTPLQAALVIVVALIAYAGKQWGGFGDSPAATSNPTSSVSTANPSDSTDTPKARIESIIRDGLSGEIIQASATVTKTLPDDNDGSRHQRFIVRLDSGRTLLIAHNIDLAKRVPASEGDAIRFRGQYETNERDGVIHWTHRDPANRHPGGWIRHDGREYK